MNDEGSVLFGFCVGVISVLAVIGLIFLGSTVGVDDVSDVEFKARYAVIVDDVPFLCLSEPGISRKFVILHKCDGTQSRRVTIRNYDSVTVTPIERVE